MRHMAETRSKLNFVPRDDPPSELIEMTGQYKSRLASECYRIAGSPEYEYCGENFDYLLVDWSQLGSSSPSNQNTFRSHSGQRPADTCSDQRPSILTMNTLP